MVHDVDVLVHAAAERAADGHAEGPGRHHPVGGQHGSVGEEDARGVVGDVARIEQLPLHPVAEDHPGGDEPGVGVVEALVGGPADLAVLFGDEKAHALVDHQLLGADRDL